MPRPKTHLKKDGSLRKGVSVEHIGVPDLDNMIKFVLDALNKVWWVDDSQVIAIHASKRYGEAQTILEVSDEVH